MEQRVYKGFNIVPDPRQDPETGWWTPRYLLFRATETSVRVRELESDRTFDSPDEATRHCFGHARSLIDASAQLAPQGS